MSKNKPISPKKKPAPKLKIPEKVREPTPQPSPVPVKEATPKRTQAIVEDFWKPWFIKGMKDYIRVENKTPKDDFEYCENHLIDQAIECIDIYAEKLEINRLTRDMFWLKGEAKFKTPPIVVYQAGKMTDAEIRLEQLEKDEIAKKIKEEQTRREEIVKAQTKQSGRNSSQLTHNSAGTTDRESKMALEAEENKNKKDDPLEAEYKNALKHFNRKKKVLIYCKIDKRPETVEGFDGRDPTEPKRDGDYLYGKGAADAGYAPFAALLAIKALQAQEVELPEVTIILDSEAHSGSKNLDKLLQRTTDLIGEPDIVLILSANCAFNQEKMWVLNSTRGFLDFTLTVNSLMENNHINNVGGLCPNAFHITRALLDRIEDPLTGQTKINEVDLLPEDKSEVELRDPNVTPQSIIDGYNAVKLQEAKEIVKTVGDKVLGQPACALEEGVKFVSETDLEQLYLNTVWRSSLSLQGMEGVPTIENSNLAMVGTSVKVKASLQLPPYAEINQAAKQLKAKLTTKLPYEADVKLEFDGHRQGWQMPQLLPWQIEALGKCSGHFFKRECGTFSYGGLMPPCSRLDVLTDRFTTSQFLRFGVGLKIDLEEGKPIEALNLPYTKKIICSLTHLLGEIAKFNTSDD